MQTVHWKYFIMRGFSLLGEFIIGGFHCTQDKRNIYTLIKVFVTAKPMIISSSSPFYHDNLRAYGGEGEGEGDSSSPL